MNNDLNGRKVTGNAFSAIQPPEVMDRSLQEIRYLTVNPIVPTPVHLSLWQRFLRWLGVES